MLNLSDKELDRLSRDAAEKYDPGDPTGPGSWPKLERKLDKEFGRSGPNPLQHIRRFSFYYAPAILLVAGVSWYLLKNSKGTGQLRDSAAINRTEPSISPPRNATPGSNPATTNQNTQNPINNQQKDTYSTTSTPHDIAPSNITTPSPASPGDKTGSNGKAGLVETKAGLTETKAAPSGKAAPTATAASPETGTADALASALPSSASPSSALPPSATSATKPGSSRTDHPGRYYPGRSSRHSRTHPAGNDLSVSSRHAPSHTAVTSNSPGDLPEDKSDLAGNQYNFSQGSGRSAHAEGLQEQAKRPREPEPSFIRGLKFPGGRPRVDDSALRAFTATEGPIHPSKKSLQVNRPLQLGFIVAPDFASVNSLAGDRPGSSIGITVDYQLGHRWYAGTGFLLTRKNYAARAQDYHVPYNFYRMNNMPEADYIKGSFNMLEIPLRLRYDFSVVNNTLFFASAGASSYLATGENCSYYFPYFGREASRKFDYQGHKSYLFAAVDLSLGVESGISNDFSIYMAPYVKFPTGSAGLGFGHVQISSVGINFGVKYAPVLSRKRR